MIELVLLIVVAAWNIITFSLYGIDKHKARNRKSSGFASQNRASRARLLAGTRRISESTLILCAFFMGGAGALLGMMIFRHKTKNPKFKLLVPLALVINIGTGLFILHYFGIINITELWQ